MHYIYSINLIPFDLEDSFNFINQSHFRKICDGSWLLTLKYAFLILSMVLQENSWQILTLEHIFVSHLQSWHARACNLSLSQIQANPFFLSDNREKNVFHLGKYSKCKFFKNKTSFTLYKPLLLLLVVSPGCSEGHASLLQDWLPWIQVVELEFEFVPLQPVLALPLWYTFWQLEILEATAGGDGVGFLKHNTIIVLLE
jgi:hypothetical protein